MQKDKRLYELAENVLKNSVKLKKGEKVYLEVFGPTVLDLMAIFIEKIAEMGGVPFYFYNDEHLLKSFISHASEEQMKKFGEIYQKQMAESDVYIALRGFDDIFALSDVNEKQMALYMQHYSNPVHRSTRVPHTRWCVMRYPNAAMAALAKMSLEAFENFYFDACLVDYKQMCAAMTPLKDLMKRTDRVRIVAPGTDLSFSIKGIPAIKCCGELNIPDGEVFTAPVKDSINGVVQFNTDTVYNGIFFSNIRLTFKDGKIIEAHSHVNNDKLQEILETDDGAKYMGEFAFGLNPGITHPILDILFDEKIGGSFHMAIGNSYDEAPNGNSSAVHWDLIQMQDAAHGGGEIYLDDVLVRKDGLFVLPELQGLNPENLK